MKGTPNIYYYAPYDTYKGRKVGTWAKSMNLACSGDWFVGDDFAVTFKSWADSYFKHPQMLVFDESNSKYPELVKHLKQLEHTRFYIKSKADFLRSIGLTPLPEGEVKE